MRFLIYLLFLSTSVQAQDTLSITGRILLQEKFESKINHSITQTYYLVLFRVEEGGLCEDFIVLYSENRIEQSLYAFLTIQVVQYQEIENSSESLIELLHVSDNVLSQGRKRKYVFLKII
jgi:hypothetical protein